MLARSAEPEDFAAALEQLVRGPGRRLAVGARAFERVREDFTAERMAEDAETVYRNAALAGSPPESEAA